MADDIEALIRRVNDDEPGAQAALFDAAYADLRQLARARLRDGGRGTVLDTTALVHESFLRFIRSGRLRSSDRRAFFAYASLVMRTVIVDTVRERQTLRAGGDLRRTTLDTHVAESLPAAQVQILDVHEALLTLAQAEPRMARIVEMRYFGGYSEAEVAETLDIHERTVRREWQKARLLLAALLAG